MIGLAGVHALLALSIPQLASDTAVAVSRGSRLDVGTGSVAVRVEVRAWDRDEVAVDANRGVRLTRDGTLVRVRPAPSGRGQPGRGEQATYRISVPAWLPVTVDSNRASVFVDGVTADVSVETVNGSVRIRGSEGRVSAHSMQGTVTIEEARGTVDASSMNDDVRVSGATGQLQLEAVNGDIRVIGGQLRDVLATSVNGSLDFESSVLPDGLYRLSTHNGRIRMTVQDGASATVSASTYAGEFRTTFPVAITERTRNGRSTFVIGSGSARIEVSSFNGSIEFRRPGQPPGRIG
jgi:hypothetical protein